MNNNEISAEKIVGSVLGIGFAGLILVGAMAYGIISHAFVGSILWKWFIVPTFGLPALTMMQAYGVSIIARLWTLQHFTWKGKDERSVTQKVMEAVGLILSPWVFLFFGWIAKIWMG